MTVLQLFYNTRRDKCRVTAQNSHRPGADARRARQAVERAIEAYAVSRERNLATRARLAYSNIKDFTRLVGSERVVDFSLATEDHTV